MVVSEEDYRYKLTTSLSDVARGFYNLEMRYDESKSFVDHSKQAE